MGNIKIQNLVHNANGISKQWKNDNTSNGVATSGKIFRKQEQLDAGLMPCTNIHQKSRGKAFLEGSSQFHGCTEASCPISSSLAL